MKFTYFGHSCFQLHTQGKILLFDPFISPNPLASAVSLQGIQADYILISHGHSDHIADAVALQRQTGATAVANWEICSWLERQGVERTHPMNTGGKWKFDFGTVAMTSALHSSSFPDGSYAGNPSGFIIANDEGTFYYSGDTALSSEMALLGKRFDINVAALPIGDNFTMDYQDAAYASEMLQCNTVIGTHYDTFGYIEIDKEAARQYFVSQKKTLLLPAIGETIEI
ncbi:metal-dependent hydrolase [Ignavibacteria bacterium]|nr:metal-dependent hydrolase [Bacteroidota bacterium]MCZ2133147.1 metal-dependent hydrolase [Bacteroidota bacterium]